MSRENVTKAYPFDGIPWTAMGTLLSHCYVSWQLFENIFDQSAWFFGCFCTTTRQFKFVKENNRLDDIFPETDRLFYVTKGDGILSMELCQMGTLLSHFGVTWTDERYHTHYPKSWFSIPGSTAKVTTFFKTQICLLGAVLGFTWSHAYSFVECP